MYESIIRYPYGVCVYGVVFSYKLSTQDSYYEHEVQIIGNITVQQIALFNTSMHIFILWLNTVTYVKIIKHGFYLVNFVFYYVSFVKYIHKTGFLKTYFEIILFILRYISTFYRKSLIRYPMC